MPMHRTLLIATLALLGACSGPGATASNEPSTGAARAGAGRQLAAYRDDAELTAALERWRAQSERRRQEVRASNAPLMMQGAPAPAAPAAESVTAAKSADAAGAAGESITNVQTAGVDEGGIVKRAGDYLVILRRGRLFTVRVGGDALQPVAMADAYAPDANPRGAWYDEMLVEGSTVVVVGYSYARGGTEVGLFELGRDGTLAYRATYHLRSFDYYSARNYASRLIGRKLIFYSPTLLQPWGRHPLEMMPGLRRWHGEHAPASFERILPATRIYRTDDDFEPSQALALHTVTACDLGAAEMRCESTAVLGPAGRVFYVSQGSVYVWTHSRGPLVVPLAPGARPATPPRTLAAVFRIPLDGSAPSALKTAGVPIDQLSFLEDGSGHLNVLLRETGAGEGMWGNEDTRGRMAQLRVPLSAFGDGRAAAQREHYRLLPALPSGAVHNRYVGDWLLWGGGPSWRQPAPLDGERSAHAPAYALRYAAAGEAIALHPGHAVERIEALGAHAVLVGRAQADLGFTAVRLGRSDATLAGRYVQPGASQGETRTHGFFYRPTGADEGMLGLPILGPGAGRRSGVYAGGGGAASVLFLRQRQLDFHALGELVAQPGRQDDGCKASCVDWYGNARPIFLGERVFALLGYELVEGRLAGRDAHWRAGDERIDERRRIDFAPGAAASGGRYSPFN